MSYPYVIQVYAFMPLFRALTTTRSSDNTKTYLRKGENFIRTQRSSSTALPKMHLVYFSLSYPQNLLPICASSRLMCFVFLKKWNVFFGSKKRGAWWWIVVANFLSFMVAQWVKITQKGLNLQYCERSKLRLFPKWIHLNFRAKNQHQNL